MTNIRGILLAFVLVLAVFSSLEIAGAASCGRDDDSQLIFRMNSNTNSHAATYNKTQYAREVCYTDFFDEPYISSENLRKCDSADKNMLFNLSSSINSHASYDPLSGYDIGICYDGFKDCYLAPSSEGCSKIISDNENEIVYLSSRTNAHLSRVPNALYPFVLCCKGKVGKPIKGDLGIRCSDYKTEASCNANAIVGQFDSSCPEGQTCVCEWSSTLKKCAVVYTDAKTNCKCTKTPGNVCDANNQMEIIATSEPVGCNAEGCVSGEKVPCVFELSELPFFEGWHFVISLIVVALIYFVFCRKH
ncbi:MAG: hypothetical protein QXD13_00405 [Candidatus Pacearchaeota archaeon]